MVDNKVVYVIKASNGQYYKKDKHSGEWLESSAKCSKFTTRDKAKEHYDMLSGYFKIDCSIIKH